MTTFFRMYSNIRFSLSVAVFLFLFLTPARTGQCATVDDTGRDPASSGRQYYIEISINKTTLTLYEKTGDGELIPLRKYPVGSAVRGLDIYPTGLGKVTGIYFDPWWYPTPYSRQVFLKRGIVLSRAVPPGHPLNYMGKFKIALSHRKKKAPFSGTKKGRHFCREARGTFLLLVDKINSFPLSFPAESPEMFN